MVEEIKQHSKYSASGSAGWLTCAGKIAMEQGISDTSSPYADEGSAAHFLAATCLQEGRLPAYYQGEEIICYTNAEGHSTQEFYNRRIPAYPNSSIWKADVNMCDYIEGYCKFVNTIGGKGATVLVEQKVTFGDTIGRPGEFGTADVIELSADGHDLYVTDLKYGYGEVKAEENPQLSLYALGALATLDMVLMDFSNLERIHLCIYQPRISNVSVWTTDLAYLKAFTVRAKAAVARSEEALRLSPPDPDEWGKEYLNPSEKGCKWCKRGGDCPALATAMLELVATPDIGDLEDLDNLPAVIDTDLVASVDSAIKMVPTLDFDTIARLYGALGRIEDWCSAVAAKMNGELLNGAQHPDWKLVKGKQGNRAWSDKGEAENVMKSMRLKLDEMYDKTVISPTAAEKLLLKTRSRLWNKLQPLITRSEGKIAIAPASDKREAIVVQTTVEMLPDLSSSEDNFEDLI